MKLLDPEKSLRMIGRRLTFSEWVTFCSPRDRTYGIGPRVSALKTRSPKLRLVEGLDQHGRAGQGQRHNSLDQHFQILEQHGSVQRDVSRFHGRLLEACTQDWGSASVRLAMVLSTRSQIGLRSQFQEPLPSGGKNPREAESGLLDAGLCCRVPAGCGAHTQASLTLANVQIQPARSSVQRLSLVDTPK